jgi:hypothetical protein
MFCLYLLIYCHIGNNNNGIYKKLISFWCTYEIIINFREYRRGNQKCTIQRNRRHRTHKTMTNKAKTQHNMCWTPLCKKKTQITHITYIRQELFYKQLKVNMKIYHSYTSYYYSYWILIIMKKLIIPLIRKKSLKIPIRGILCVR